MLEVSLQFHGFRNNNIQGIKQELIAFLFNVKHTIPQFKKKYAPHPMQCRKSTH
jgi:hypothetical protein